MRISPAIVGPYSAAQNISLVYYDVRDYGALLNGVTDDAGAIQATIDAATAAGGGVVVIPGTTAHSAIVNSTLIVKNGVWLRGSGSQTNLAGTANPVITITDTPGADRMAITDMSITPSGDGILLAANGATQLGWARIIIENVTMADGSGTHFKADTGILETRFINCVSLRAGSRGFHSSNGTDLLFYGCTAAESAAHGFDLQGANHKLVCCKAYGCDLNGFNLAGAGRHTLAGCESQDNVGYGYACVAGHNTIGGCLSDSEGLAGVYMLGDRNSVNGTFIHGGGGTGQQTKAGVFFEIGTRQNVVAGVTNNDVPVAGDAGGNTAYLNAGPGSRKTIAYTATWTPNPYEAEIQAMTLTGNLTLVNPVYKHVGQQLTLELRQDGSGSHTVTFPDQFRASWTPVTTANALNIISFEYDGTAWQQTSSVVGLTPKPSIGVGDTFNRANEALNVSSSGATWTKYNQDGGASWQVVSNQVKTSGSGGFHTNIAVLDAGVPDFTAQVTVVNDSGLGSGIVWRYTDSSNYFVAASNIVGRVVAGVTTTIATIGAIATGDVVSVLVSGPNHFVYKNGTLILTFPDAFNVSATKAGITAGGDTSILDAFSIV